jgi:NADPH2:quinone reductase
MLLPLLLGRGRAHHGHILRRLAGLVDGGRIRPLLDPEIFPFTRATDAHRKLESGTAVGKIALVNDLI